MPNFPRWRVDEEEKCDPSIVSMFGEVVYYSSPLSTYPNPSSGLITIELPEEKSSGIMRITNSVGNVMLQREIELLTKSYSLDLGFYPRGVYFIEFLPSKNKSRTVYTAKVILE